MLRFTCTCSALLIALVSATGQDMDLPETVVTATRVDDELLEIPNAVSLLGEDQLLERMVRTLPEAMGEMAGVMEQHRADAAST